MDEVEASEGETQEVHYTEATDEELDAAIAADAPVEEVDENPEPEDKEPASQPKPEAAEPDYKALFEAAKEEAARREAHIKQIELFNKRRSTELGETRKERDHLRALIEQKSQGLDEKFLEKPTEALRDAAQIREAEEALQALDAEDAEEQHAQAAFETVARYIPKEEFDIPTMVAVLRQEGVDEGFIQAFQENPFKRTHGETLVFLARYGQSQRRLSELAGYTKKLLQENETLKAKPKNVLQRVDRASRETPSITASNGGAAPRGRPSMKNLSRMSDAELDEAIAATQN